MSDGYLVSLLFKDGKNGLVNQELSDHQHWFNAEDELKDENTEQRELSLHFLKCGEDRSFDISVPQQQSDFFVSPSSISPIPGTEGPLEISEKLQSYLEPDPSDIDFSIEPHELHNIGRPYGSDEESNDCQSIDYTRKPTRCHSTAAPSKRPYPQQTCRNSDGQYPGEQRSVSSSAVAGERCSSFNLEKTGLKISNSSLCETEITQRHSIHHTVSSPSHFLQSDELHQRAIDSYSISSSNTSTKLNSQQSKEIGRYGTHHVSRSIASAAVSVPIKLFNMLRISNPQPNAKRSVTDSQDTKDDAGRISSKRYSRSFSTNQLPSNFIYQKESLDGLSNKHDANATGRRSLAFSAIPCINGLAVRNSTGSKHSNQERETSTSRWVLGSRLRKLSQPNGPGFQDKGFVSPIRLPTTPMCWLNIVAWGGFGGSGKVWGFLDSTDYQAEPIFKSPFIDSKAQMNASDSGRTGFSTQSNTSRALDSSGRPQQTIAGIILGTGNSANDRLASARMLRQYIKVARSIRRVSRAFSEIVASSKLATQLQLNAVSLSNKSIDKSINGYVPRPTNSPSRSSPPLHGERRVTESINSCPNRGDATNLGARVQMNRKLISSIQDDEAVFNHKTSSGISSEASVPQRGVDSAKCEKKACNNLLHTRTADRQASSKDVPCIAACFMEVLLFVQSILRLKKRQRKSRNFSSRSQKPQGTDKQQIYPSNLASSEATQEKPSSCSKFGPSLEDVPKPLETPEEEALILLSTSYWIVFISMWVEKRLHVVAREIDDPSLIHRFCCCRLFSTADLKSMTQPESAATTVAAEALRSSRSLYRLNTQQTLLSLSPNAPTYRASVTSSKSNSHLNYLTRSIDPNSSWSSRLNANPPVHCIHDSHGINAIGTGNTSLPVFGGNGVNSILIAGEAAVSSQNSVRCFHGRESDMMTPNIDKESIKHSHATQSQVSLRHLLPRPESSSSNRGEILFRELSSKDQEGSPKPEEPMDVTYRAALNQEFARLEKIDLLKEDGNQNHDWGSQVDTIRRFLVLCFCAWSWIEDENISSNSIVDILQHAWWCTNSQITFGLSEITRPAALGSSMQTSGQAEPRGLVFGSPRIGRFAVQRLREAVAATSRGRLFAQCFGHQQNDKQSQGSIHPISKNKPTDFYAEYLALPSSCSTSEFELQVFTLMKSLGYNLAAFPENVTALSKLWQRVLEEEDCCVRYSGSKFGCADSELPTGLSL